MTAPRIAKIEVARLEGRRPRHAGKNARLDDHGIVVRPPVCRVTLDDGATGVGISRATRETLQSLLGTPFDEAFALGSGPAERFRPIEFPLWDLAGKTAGQPVYQLLAAAHGKRVDEPFRAPCYDTSLYIDDLHIADEAEAAALVASEAREGYERGHRAFKIKIGRGARHLPLEEGTQRDIAVIRAVRQAVGPECPIMLDANNGYNLNLTKRVLSETADCGIFWMEEAFHEDAILYRDLRAWLDKEGIATLIADGEGSASPSLMDWARDGIVQVIQYDVISPGFTRWLEIGLQLDFWGVRSAPHHYGGLYGNFVSGHLAAAIDGYTYAEWDEATAPGLDAPGYAVHDGYVTIPNTSGFGLTLDDSAFRRALSTDGFTLTL